MTTIKRVGVFSLAKVMGFTGFLMGALAACFWGVLIFGFGSTATPGTPGASFIEGAGGVLLAAIPLLYGIGSFVVGLIYGVFANVVLLLSGGLEVELAEPSRP